MTASALVRDTPPEIDVRIAMSDGVELAATLYLPNGVAPQPCLLEALLSKNPDDEVEIKIPKIHESALKRIREGAHVYAPVGFPEHYAVVTDDGMVLPAAQNRYETPVEAKARATAQERVWNLVWLRRVIYFATVLASLHLLLYPLIETFPPGAEYSTALRPVSDLVRFLDSFPLTGSGKVRRVELARMISAEESSRR